MLRRMPDLARLCTLYALLCTCIHVHRSHANSARFETDEEGDSEVVTLCPAIKDALVFAAAPGRGHATPLALAGKPPARCLVIAAGSSGCAGHGCIGLGSCVDAPAWETAPAPGGHGQMVRTAQGAVCLDFNAGAMRLQAYDCLNGTTHLNQHWAVDTSAWQQQQQCGAQQLVHRTVVPSVARRVHLLGAAQPASSTASTAGTTALRRADRRVA